MEGTSDTWTKTSPLFHYACLICPLSFLHQPIVTDTAPHPTQLATTYITLTNQRLWGFFLPRFYHWHLLLSTSSVPIIRLICLAKKMTRVKQLISRYDLLLIWILLTFHLRIQVVSFLLPFSYCASAILYLLPPFIASLLLSPPLFSSPTTVFPFIVLSSWAYWHVTVEWACLHICDIHNSVD